jgi:hypothetical protein
MNMEKGPTVQELRELINAQNDRAGHHVLWVAKTGDVRVSMVPEDLTPVGFEDEHPEMQLRLETFQAGNDYVGPNAANDVDWINQLFEALKKEWAQAKGKREVQYVDQF